MSGDNVTAATVNVTAPEDGDNVWRIDQVEDEFLSYQDGDNFHQIDWSFGPVKLSGFLDTDTYDVTISPNITGINCGTIKGNMKDGIGIRINLMTSKGETRLYLKNGNETWVHLDIKIIFDGHYEGDYKLFSF